MLIPRPATTVAWFGDTRREASTVAWFGEILREATTVAWLNEVPREAIVVRRRGELGVLFITYLRRLRSASSRKSVDRGGRYRPVLLDRHRRDHGATSDSVRRGPPDAPSTVNYSAETALERH
jgi:hypothetical protein